MKKLLFILLMAFMFVSCQTANNSPEMAKMSPKVDAVIAADYNVDSTLVDSINGKPIQIVYLANGDQMIFSDAYKSISDLDIKVNYMTYRKVKAYELLKDSLTSISPHIDSGIIDLLAFNHFLDKQGLQVITKDQYSSLIAQSNQVEKLNTIVIALYFLFGLSVTAMLLLIVSILAVAKKASNVLDTNSVYISKETNTC